VAVLDWLNQVFSTTNDPEGAVFDMVDALRSARAGWRENGRLGGLADCLTAAGALTTYPTSGNLLTGEVLYSQGGESQWLALSYAHVAMRLGLFVDRVSVPEGRPYAVAEGAVFGPAPRPAKPGDCVPVDGAVLSLAMAVAERESARGNLAFPGLLALLERLGGDASRLPNLRETWAGEVARRLPSMDDESVHSLLVSNADLPVGMLDAGSLHGLALRLGRDRAPLRLLEALLAKSLGAAFLDGTLVAEVVLERSLPPNPATPAPLPENLFSALVAAVDLAPARFAAAMALITSRGGSAEAHRFATALWDHGTRPFGVAAVLAQSALSSDSPDRMRALGVLAEAAIENLTPRDDRRGASSFGSASEVRPEAAAIALTVVRHAGILALELEQWELASQVVELGLATWPDDPVLWRTLAELGIFRGDHQGAKAVLSRMLAAWPESERTRARLGEIMEQEGFLGGGE
jgi:hypothetical protein